MPATVVGIIYSKNQEVIRARIDTRPEVRFTGRYTDEGQPINERIMTDGNDGHLAHYIQNLLPGEGWKTVDLETHDRLMNNPEGNGHHLLHVHLGLKGIHGKDDAYHIVDKDGNIVNTELLDPDIDCPNGVWRHPDKAIQYSEYPGHKLIKR
jgi:hypothetical protein